MILKSNFFNIAVFIVVIGFMVMPLTGCHEDVEILPPLSGSILITHRNINSDLADKFHPIVGETLEATYTGPVPQANIKFQWRKEGSKENLYPDQADMFLAGPFEFTPTIIGNYTVYATSKGYSSIKKNVHVINDPREPTEEQYDFSNFLQDINNITAVTITPKAFILGNATLDGKPISGDSLDGSMRVYYQKKDAPSKVEDLPTETGIYDVTFDVIPNDDFFTPANELSAGQLVIYEKKPEQTFSNLADLKTFITTSTSSDTPNIYYITLENINTLGGDRWKNGSIGNILNEIPANVYIYLDLSNTSITTIENDAFYNLDNIVGIKLNNSVSSIGDAAFYSCSTLISSITIPSLVTSIGENVFGFCPLTSVTFDGKIPANKLPSSFGEEIGDLKTKYLAGGIGTYRRTKLQEGYSPWEKQ